MVGVGSMALMTTADQTPAEEPEGVLAHWDGPLLVLGGPGTGKTTLVARAAVELVRAGRNPLVLAPSRAAASALRNRIAHGWGNTSQLAVTTVHAMARSLVDQHSDSGDRRLLTAPEQEFRVRELLAGDPGGRWPEQLRQAVGTRGFARQLRGVLARARQLGLDPSDIARFGAEAGLPEWVAAGDFFAEYLDVLDADGTLDYAELVHRARILLADPAVLGDVRDRFDAVLLDDLTDLDPAQIGLVRALVPDGGDTLATADPQAAVNTFRGAHPRAAADFPKIFTAADGGPGRVQVLRQGLRAGGELAAALARVASRLPVAVPGAPEGTIPATRTGSVRVITCSGEAAQARAIATELRRARIERGIGYHEMAVIARSGTPLAVIGRACAAAGVAVDLAAGDVVLAAAQAVRPLLLALEVTARGAVLPEEVTRLLTSPLAGFDPVGLRHLVRQWRHAHAGQDGAGLALGSDEVLAAAVNQPEWADGDAPTAQQRQLGRLVGLLAQARAACLAGQRADEVGWLLWNGTRWPARLRAEALAGGPAGRQADRDLDTVGALFEVAAESTGTGPGGIALLLEEIAAQQIPADREREGRPGARGVQLLTAHRARGREWALVVVAGVQEGVWPAPRRLTSVLEPERLLSDGIGGRTDSRELLIAERRLFHLACGRARQELIVTATAGTEGEANQPSRFLGELGVDAESPDPGPPVTLTGLVGGLRRALLAPDSSPQRRWAAAANLAALAGEAVDGAPLVPAADPRTWWGVRPLSSAGQPSEGPIQLSPSQVTALLTCPRRHFLSRDARAEGPPAVGASLGSVIHLLVQHASTGGLDDAEVGHQLDAAWQQLRFETGWLSAVERVEAESSIQRFLAWREQRTTEPVAVEADFRLDLEVDGRQVTLTGAVDRLERTADGRLAVVDFKTGRTLPTRDEVAGMDQLGIYQLAVESGAFADVAEGTTESAGASVVYLRQPGKLESLPRELAQDPLGQRPHLGAPGEQDYPTWVHHRVAKAAGILAEGSFHAAPGGHCRRCPFAGSCPASGRGEQVLR